MDNKVILVMEDDTDIAWLVQHKLEKAGYRVLTAADGASGLDAFSAHGADLVLLDINMPVLDGWAVYSRLREVSQVPIVLLTAYSHDRERIQSLNSDPRYHLSKPFSLKELLARVAMILGDKLMDDRIAS